MTIQDLIAHFDDMEDKIQQQAIQWILRCRYDIAISDGESEQEAVESAFHELKAALNNEPNS